VARSTLSFRQEIPKHVAWSSDGSILAVSAGPYVALYDPLTNALIQALTTPECDRILSCHFVGSSNRYLAARGQFDVILWDLLTHNGGSCSRLLNTHLLTSDLVQWHYSSHYPISTIVPHSNAESLAVFQQLPTFVNDSTQSSQVLLMHPGSAIPNTVAKIPFHLRNVTWYPMSPAQSSKSREPLYSLVGITETWSVILFGDDVQAPSDDGARAKEIAAQSSNPHKQSLFEGIFGKSAFADLSSQPPMSVFDSVATSHSWGAKDVAGIFDAPAYLMPPLETLFDSIMSGFLKPRNANTDGATSHGEERDEDKDEDEGMDALDDDGPVIVGPQPERVVDWGEMNTFIELFKHHAMKRERMSYVTIETV
jgi:NET1-associated nuclear protein 1 (U3 small nucleolar RNA-associated protein 17)